MKTHSTNYQDTFIEIAEDCPIVSGEIPPAKDDAKSVATMQYELIKKHPYKYTSDDVFFKIYAERNDIADSELEKARALFFSKGQPCFRASPLTKRYGWGVHSDKNGKIALYGAETSAYEKFSKDKKLKVIKAMKSKK
jgi:Family of unknown function (DUF6157)